MPRRRPKVLILDGDSASCLALHRALFDGDAYYDILLATTADVARAIMRDIGVDVLVIDVDIPRAGGVDFVCWAALEFPEAVYVVQTRSKVDDLEPRMGGLGCLRLIKKPCPAGELLKIIHEALDCIHRLSGCFSTLSAADLIQMLCLAQRTAALRIMAGGVAGSVMIREGQLVHATWGNVCGPEALCAILDARDGVFRTTPLPEAVEQSIHLDWQHALMEAVRTLDERASSTRRSTGSLPAIRIEDPLLDKIAAAPLPERHERKSSSKVDDARGNNNNNKAGDTRKSPRPGGVASSLVDRGFAALRAGDKEQARQCWLAAKQLDPENRAIDLNLKKLESKAIR